MNSYKMTVNKPATVIKKWLLSKQCPKAASTIKNTATGCEYVVEGNVSAWSHMGVLTDKGYEVNMEPIGNSQKFEPVVMVF